MHDSNQMFGKSSVSTPDFLMYNSNHLQLKFNNCMDFEVYCAYCLCLIVFSECDLRMIIFYYVTFTVKKLTALMEQ